MLREYADAAMRRARYEIIDNPEPYYGEIRVCRGVWATGKTLEDCRSRLQEVLEGWVLLRIQKGLPVPTIGRCTVKPLRRMLTGSV